MTILTVTLIIFAVGLLIGIPISFAVLSATAVYFLMSPMTDILLVQRVVASVESFPLLAIPFFILAGTAMARGGIAERLMGVADALVGHRRGGLGQVNVLSSLLMGGMSGSANADAAVNAKVLVPVMVRKGYGRGFSSALSAATGIIAPIIPPGIGMILYGLLAGVSVGRLFIAGIVPGLLLALALGITVSRISAKRGYGADRESRLPWKEVRRLAREAVWALIMPVLLIVGLRIGVFTPTELGAVLAVYALVVGIFVYREIRLNQLMDVCREALLTTAAVMLIVATAGAFSFVITLERLPQQLLGVVLSMSSEPFVILLLLNLLLLVMGTLLESTALLIILTPILAPLAPALGIDPVQLGVVIVLNLTIGGFTPPVGTVMYTTLSVTGSPIEEYTREVGPFIFAVAVVLLLVTFVPSITLILPNLVFG
jgi:tripartite ATP-independent transporter DctM subunit